MFCLISSSNDITGCRIAFFVLACHVHPSKKFLGKILPKTCPRLAQDLAQSAKIMPAKFWPRSWPRSYSRYDSRLAGSWPPDKILDRARSKILDRSEIGQESCPRTFCWACACPVWMDELLYREDAVSSREDRRPCFFGVPSSVTECLQPVTELGHQKNMATDLPGITLHPLYCLLSIFQTRALKYYFLHISHFVATSLGLATRTG